MKFFLIETEFSGIAKSCSLMTLRWSAFGKLIILPLLTIKVNSTDADNFVEFFVQPRLASEFDAQHTRISDDSNKTRRCNGSYGPTAI